MAIKAQRKERQAKVLSPDEAKSQAKMVNGVSLAVFFIVEALIIAVGVLMSEVLHVGDVWVAAFDRGRHPDRDLPPVRGQDRRPVGKGGRPALWQVQRAQGTGPVLDHPDRGHDSASGSTTG